MRDVRTAGTDRNRDVWCVGVAGALFPRRAPAVLHGSGQFARHELAGAPPELHIQAAGPRGAAVPRTPAAARRAAVDPAPRRQAPVSPVSYLK